MVGNLADFPNMHDWREPSPGGVPPRGQSCAKFARGQGADTERTYCGKSFPTEPIPPGCAVLREDPTRTSLFRIWTQRNCKFANNFNPLITRSLLDNMDIQGCASKYGVVSYVTPYITHHGTKGGAPFAYSEHILGQCLARSVEGNKTAQFGMTRFSNAQVAPSIISQLEVRHVNWGIPRYIHPRPIRALSLNSRLKRARTPDEIAADGRGDGAPFAKRSAIQLYED